MVRRTMGDDRHVPDIGRPVHHLPDLFHVSGYGELWRRRFRQLSGQAYLLNGKAT